MIYLFFLFIFRFFLFKCFKNILKNIFLSHFLSISISVIFFIFYSIYIMMNPFDLELFLLIICLFLSLNYIIINVPGAYITSIRIKIFSILIKTDIIEKNFLFKKFNDEILYEDRLQRLLSNKIIMKDNNFFNIKQKRLYYFISFLNLMKFLYKFVNKY